MDETLTFESFDKFERQKFADRLTTVISTFYPFYNEAFVLSLNAKFGAGKTTFLKMWENHFKKDDFTVIYINAWETDFDDEPIIPIISALLDGITTGKAFNELKLALQGALGTVVLAGNGVLGHATGINLNEILKEVETNLKNTDIQALGDELYKEYSFKKKAYSSLKSELTAFIEKIEKKPLVVFVDELDRVRPDYSVKFLEAIKHIFSVQGICFVLAVDRDQLEASVRQLYGDIDFENYYRRFVTREAPLPDVTKVDLMPFIQFQANNFIDEKINVGIKFPFSAQGQQDALNFISAVCRAFHFLPRQIEALFRIFSQLMAVVKTDQMASITWINAATLLIAISIDKRSLYKNLGTALVSPYELYEYITSLDFSSPNDDYASYMVSLSMGSCMRDGQREELNQIADLCLKFEEITTSPEDLNEKRHSMIQDLGRSLYPQRPLNRKSAFQSIYTQIEEWRAFIK